MTVYGKRNISAGKMFIAIALAVVAGMISPFLLMISPIVFITPVIATALYAYAGVTPFAILTGIEIGVVFSGFGTLPAAMLMLAVVVPSFATLYMIRRRIRFVEQIRNCVVINILCVFLAVFLCYLASGESLIDAIMREFGEQLSILSDEIKDLLLTRFTDVTMRGGSLDAAERLLSINMFLSNLGILLSQSLAGVLLSSATLTAVMQTAIPNRALVKQGGLPDECYLPLRQWHLPASATYGLILMYVVAYIIYSTGYEGGEAVYVAAQALAVLGFSIQAVSSLERRLSARITKPIVRGLVIALAILFIGGILVYYGCLSALFGTYGAAGVIKIRKNNDKDE